MTTTQSAAANLVRRAGLAIVRRHNQHELHVDSPLPSAPALLVSNHGHGGITDLNVYALGATLDELGVRDSVVFLTHQIAWTLGFGAIAEQLGCRPASKESADEAFAARQYVAVFPGGDVDAAKPYQERHRIKFGGRSGYARLAMEHEVPVVPVVTAGAGNSLFVLSDGQKLAKALYLPRLLRVKTLPVTLSIPWGLTIGITAILPYLPLPVKITTSVLPAMYPEEGETPADFAARVEQAMQARLDGLVR
ncbi:1-acyl-sn-glycerol-3-phosphate acyltransferase [Hoyosella altamirensis]|uniref:1-acyl-sn-glycerol-3-phosphate acyltransferase n=1 Tax=Hoyosella altamirensis TaxID=616997 RepID=A0A839RKC9_9ACTN|nr:1-acyl-sn-glycerol-3-phosphate acyltransferase [Hoyosella altamirensis]MBB3036576.1 1-acyl-sn-glycerol-3-phosphate acyltransferase [Hoyosella altamirensis]